MQLALASALAVADPAAADAVAELLADAPETLVSEAPASEALASDDSALAIPPAKHGVKRNAEDVRALAEAQRLVVVKAKGWRIAYATALEMLAALDPDATDSVRESRAKRIADDSTRMGELRSLATKHNIRYTLEDEGSAWFPESRDFASEAVVVEQNRKRKAKREGKATDLIDTTANFDRDACREIRSHNNRVNRDRDPLAMGSAEDLLRNIRTFVSQARNTAGFDAEGSHEALSEALEYLVDKWPCKRGFAVTHDMWERCIAQVIADQSAPFVRGPMRFQGQTPLPLEVTSKRGQTLREVSTAAKRIADAATRS